MALLVGRNVDDTGIAQDYNATEVIHFTAGHTAVATGDATTAYVRTLNWSAVEERHVKVVVWNSVGTIIGISNPSDVPGMSVSWVAATFASPPAIVSGQNYKLGVIASGSHLQIFSEGVAAWQCSIATGTYSYADPSGAVVGVADNKQFQQLAVYLDGAVGGSDLGVSLGEPVIGSSVF